MKNLTKFQKFVVLLTVFWELVAFAGAKEASWNHRGFDFGVFIGASFPCILYWGGVWIFGFGYILKAIRKINNFIFGQNPLTFFFSYKGNFNRLQYFKGIFILAWFAAGISLIENTIFLFLFGGLYFYILFAFVQKRSRDLGETGTRAVIILCLGWMAKELYTGLDLEDNLIALFIFCPFAFAAVGMNLYLLFYKGCSNPDMEKTSPLLKRPFLTVVGWYLLIILTLLVGQSIQSYVKEDENNKNMATYILTTADGREVEIDSPTPPSQELADQVFAAAGIKTDRTQKQGDLDKFSGKLASLTDALHDVSEATRDICMAWFYENNVVNNIAAPICKCEQDTVYNEIPLNDILYYQDNIGRWNFLIYKKDAKALEINEKIGKIRLNCIDMFSGKSN